MQQPPTRFELLFGGLSGSPFILLRIASLGSCFGYVASPETDRIASERGCGTCLVERIALVGLGL